jgi:hypothetical protein
MYKSTIILKNLVLVVEQYCRCEQMFQNLLPESDVHPYSNCKCKECTQFLHGVTQLASVNEDIHEKTHSSNIKTHYYGSTVDCVNF